MPVSCSGTRLALVALALALAASPEFTTPSRAAQSQSADSQSGDSRTQGGQSEDGQAETEDSQAYVELFDPESEDPGEPPERSVPKMPLDADEFIGLDDEQETKTDEARFPWDPKPERVPDRVLAPGDPRDPRSVELFYYGCSDELHRRDVTLFANGTLRLRRGPLGEQEMQLEELGPVELRRHLNRLLRIRASRDFPSQQQMDGGLGGRWTDTCRFGLDLPGFEPVEVEVGALDMLPLELRQLQQYSDRLAGLTRPLVRPDGLPSDYVPEIGDLLRTHDGKLYRVRGRTADGGALELESVDGNWRIFVPEDEFPEHFVALEIDLTNLR